MWILPTDVETARVRAGDHQGMLHAEWTVGRPDVPRARKDHAHRRGHRHGTGIPRLHLVSH